MNVLDSPLEALAFNYLSFGFLTLLNNLWTWVAVATAAVSFWRILAAGCPKNQLQLPRDDPPSALPDPVLEVLTPPAAASEPPRPADVGSAYADVDGLTKRKFTLYYEDDRQCGESLTVTEDWEEREGGESEWWEWWESLLRVRTGESEKGWYTCQDLTELNGNVVRLWEGGFDSVTRESWYSSSCIHVW